MFFKCLVYNFRYMKKIIIIFGLIILIVFFGPFIYDATSVLRGARALSDSERLGLGLWVVFGSMVFIGATAAFAVVALLRSILRFIKK